MDHLLNSIFYFFVFLQIYHVHFNPKVKFCVSRRTFIQKNFEIWMSDFYTLMLIMKYEVFKMNKILHSITVGIFSLVVSSFAIAGAHEAKKDIVDTAVTNGNFNTLVTAIKAAGLVETLKGEGPFTVFAPTDEAFAKIPAETLNALIADKAALTGVLTYHVVAGKVMSGDVVKLDSAKTVNGQSVAIKVVDEKVFVDGAEVTAVDVETSNGVIHVIDAVMLPK
jgi:hypothetical protein